jgi:hypothetical protein
MKAIAAILLLLAFSVPAHAAHPMREGCTVRGTSDTDIISGNDGPNTICALAAPDYAAGQAGRDRLRGGSGGDTLVGGSDRDRVLGRGGDDSLFAVDGRGGDVVRGGVGFDRCYGEEHDRFRGCEVTQTNHSPTYPRALVLALSDALERTVRVSNELLCEQDADLCLIIGVGWLHG